MWYKSSIGWVNPKNVIDKYLQEHPINSSAPGHSAYKLHSVYAYCGEWKICYAKSSTSGIWDYSVVHDGDSANYAAVRAIYTNSSNADYWFTYRYNYGSGVFEELYTNTMNSSGTSAHYEINEPSCVSSEFRAQSVHAWVYASWVNNAWVSNGINQSINGTNLNDITYILMSFKTYGVVPIMAPNSETGLYGTDTLNVAGEYKYLAYLYNVWYKYDCQNDALYYL